jgi:hypothetical protein
MCLVRLVSDQDLKNKMNAVWNHGQQVWTISFYGSPQTWTAPNITWAQGIEAFHNGGTMQNNMLVVPHQNRALRHCLVRGYVLNQRNDAEA